MRRRQNPAPVCRPAGQPRPVPSPYRRMVSGGAYPSGWLSCHAWLYGAGAFVDGAAGSAFVKGGGNGGGWKLGGVDDFVPQPH